MSRLDLLRIATCALLAAALFIVVYVAMATATTIIARSTRVRGFALQSLQQPPSDSQGTSTGTRTSLVTTVTSSTSTSYRAKERLPWDDADAGTVRLMQAP